MILHNLKIAWRNLMKYKLQTLVGVSALAVGMAGALSRSQYLPLHRGDREGERNGNSVTA